jgi:hypothetical protein
MRSKRRIHVRTAGYAEVSAKLNAEHPIVLKVFCMEEHPDIILHLEAYMASELIRQLFQGLNKLKHEVQREIDYAAEAKGE